MCKRPKQTSELKPHAQKFCRTTVSDMTTKISFAEIEQERNDFKVATDSEALKIVKYCGNDENFIYFDDEE